MINSIWNEKKDILIFEGCFATMQMFSISYSLENCQFFFNLLQRIIITHIRTEFDAATSLYFLICKQIKWRLAEIFQSLEMTAFPRTYIIYQITFSNHEIKTYILITTKSHNYYYWPNHIINYYWPWCIMFQTIQKRHSYITNSN